YKSVQQKVRPVSYPEDAHVTRQFPEDPLLTLPHLSPNPPDFVPTERLTEERLKVLRINEEGFLQPEEVKLFEQVFRNVQM
ncbi:hypothetical protein M422DRAFT_185688, partial [Sphaerobolus stellatus SS14]